MSVCEACWEEAERRQAAYGYGEDVTAIYHRLIDEDWCARTPERIAARERALARLARTSHEQPEVVTPVSPSAHEEA